MGRLIDTRWIRRILDDSSRISPEAAAKIKRMMDEHLARAPKFRPVLIVEPDVHAIDFIDLTETDA